MKEIYKIKRAGKKIQTYTLSEFKKSEPEIYSLVRPPIPQDFRIGTKKVIKLTRGRAKPVKVGVHFLHPREMSSKARRKVLGAGLSGEARRLFLEEGMTLAEQQHAGQLRSAEIRKAREEQYRRDHPEEFQRKRRTNKAKADQRRKEKGGIDYSKYYAAKHIAKASGLTAAEIRKFLRTKKIGKRGGRYAFTKKEATRIAKAAQRHYQEED